MIVKIKQSSQYVSDYKDLIFKNSEITADIAKRLSLFCRKPDDDRLRNHKLKGKLADRWAFSINDDIRIIYKWIGKNRVRFLRIGGHNKVYKK